MDGKNTDRINDEFQIIWNEQLGKGNFGTVYKGFNLKTNQIIAVKFIPANKLKVIPNWQRELEVMDGVATLKHPYIMAYYGHAQNDKGVFLFLEFCQGGCLKDIAKTKLSEVKVLQLYQELLEAMEYVNNKKYVHRDLKPDNIMFNENQEVKLADFGLARENQIEMTKGACTPLYAAPEVINLKDYDEKCDVWSAGMVLYEMLTGEEYFADVTSKKVLLQRLEAFKTGERKVTYPSRFHPNWINLTNMMLTHDPHKRPSFAEMMKTFKKHKPTMLNDLNSKYGEDFENINDGLRITQTVRPYVAKDESKNVLQKMMEEKSYLCLNNLRKYLSFFKQKSDFMTRLTKEFTSNVYGCLMNVYKYMLMFLSLSAYSSRLKVHVQELKAKEINTPVGKLNRFNFEESHQKLLDELIGEFLTKELNSIQKFQTVLRDQIIKKITGYMSRPNEKAILTGFNNFVELMQKANTGKYEPQATYLDMFKGLMNGIPYLQVNLLEELTEGEVKAYIHVRLIGNIHQFLNDKNFANEDYVRGRKQLLQNMSKTQAIEFVKPFN